MARKPACGIQLQDHSEFYRRIKKGAFMDFTAIAAFITFATTASPAVSPMTCDFARYKVCVESETADLSEDCNARGGEIVDRPCATGNLLGSCEIVEGENVVYVRYYRGFLLNPRKNCAENKGTYIPANA
jgi:hypothetical protein